MFVVFKNIITDIKLSAISVYKYLFLLYNITIANNKGGVKLNAKLNPKLIIEWRVSQGLTQMQACKMIGRSQTYWVFLEKSVITPSLGTALKLAKIMGVKIEDLVQK